MLLYKPTNSAWDQIIIVPNVVIGVITITFILKHILSDLINISQCLCEEAF